jgi:uncharacterized repeat protein (TIGR03803 family)
MKSKTLFSFVVLTLFTSLVAAMHAQTFTVIHAFTGHADGASPYAGVTILGNTLYGTTSGYPDDCGTVFQLANTVSNWLFSTLAVLPHNCGPQARVVFGPDGHLYGTSEVGGMDNDGTVFKLTPPVGICNTAACYWTVKDLHDFVSGTDGVAPGLGDLIWDQQGNIYGTTIEGGTSGLGTVYELTPSGNGYTESFLYSFSGPDGAYPYAGLVLDNKGNLFGTAQYGGSIGFGTVFELSYVVGIGWTQHVLYSFQNAGDGENPFGGLIFDSAGNLYGTTLDGGSGGGGTVFELSPSGNTWTFKLLYSLSKSYRCGPGETLTMDVAGNLYGTTACGGLYNDGSVFRLSSTEEAWVYTSLHDFTGGTDGAFVVSNVSIDTDGTLYGTAEQGGDYGFGVVWMIKP